MKNQPTFSQDKVFDMDLVFGYSVADYKNGTETLYAVSKDSIVCRTANLPNNTFSCQNVKWEKCALLPENAEFIGYYKI